MRHITKVNFASCQSNDVRSFFDKLDSVAKAKKFNKEILGRINNSYNDEIVLLTRPEIPGLPNLLIAACFHGEEPAGAWAILNFLGSVTEEILQMVNISFLPLVNPSGFRLGERNNYRGENPNRNFCHNEGPNQPSEEGRILIRSIERLRRLSSDCFISLHEDIEFEQFYIYVFEAGNEPGEFSVMLRNTEACFFDQYPDGVVEGDPVENGIVFKACDGSFEDYLFHLGVEMTACTETPGMLDIDRRIEANSKIIFNVIHFLRNNRQSKK